MKCVCVKRSIFFKFLMGQGFELTVTISKTAYQIPKVINHLCTFTIQILYLCACDCISVFISLFYAHITLTSVCRSHSPVFTKKKIWHLSLLLSSNVHYCPT